MKSILLRYTRWLHTRWPDGKVEPLPVVGPDGTTNISGVYVVGDLGGVPLLKFSSDTAARTVARIIGEPAFKNRPLPPSDSRIDGTEAKVWDVAIIGAGVSGVSAAIECAKAGLSHVLLEHSRMFATVANFPKGKPIYTYPNEMTPSGGLQYRDQDDVKERLLESLQEQARAHGIEATHANVKAVKRGSGRLMLQLHEGPGIHARRVIVAIGRSGNHRTLDIPGEELGKVSNRLHDPADHRDQDVLVVGGGDSAVESAIALTEAGAKVTLCHRGPEWVRPKPANLERLNALTRAGSLDVTLHTSPVGITPDKVVLKDGMSGATRAIENDVVFSMIGREAPLDFFRRSGLRIHGERNRRFWLTLAGMLLLLTFLYQWKKGGTWLPVAEFFQNHNWFPHNLSAWWASLGGSFADPSTLPGTLSYVIGDPGFVFSFLYTAIIVVFGIRRIRRRRTPYITRQTMTLIAFQVLPLFVLPYILLPWAGFNGCYDSGLAKTLADEFFPVVEYGSGREYWRAFGLILAWPLFVYNVFTEQPMWGWLMVSLVQTFVIIPLIIRRWGKGAYCGWVCSCGALAETLGDNHRHKMPHGPFWNKFNMLGQLFLALALLLFILRVLGWIWPQSFFGTLFNLGFYGSTSTFLLPWSYAWFVDLLWAGILGFGLYFHFSGRVWCRFACPLAALMHIYARFSRFRIFAEKSKCISCNVCTSVCHQGIDVMSFANKGLPMEDPQCVRCSACVQQCPTGVLSFGRYDGHGGNRRIVLDRTPASPVQMREQSVNPAAQNGDAP